MPMLFLIPLAAFHNSVLKFYKSSEMPQHCVYLCLGKHGQKYRYQVQHMFLFCAFINSGDAVV